MTTGFNWDASWQEQTATPDTPASGRWKLFPKADGFYSLDDAAAILRLLTTADLTALGSVYQPLDADLTAIAALATGGIIARTGAGTAAARTITGTANRVSVSNGDGVSGNPTLTVPDSAQLHVAKLVNLTTNGYQKTGGGDGTLSVESTATLFLSSAGGFPQTTTGAALSKYESATNKQSYYTLDFDQTTDEYAQWNFAMPANWNGGTVTATFYWTASGGSGDVVWALQGRAYANDDAIDQAWGTAQTTTDTLTATSDLDISPATGAITLAGSPAAGQWVAFRVYRDASAGGDTLNADALLIGIQVTYGLS